MSTEWVLHYMLAANERGWYISFPDRQICATRVYTLHSTPEEDEEARLKVLTDAKAGDELSIRAIQYIAEQKLAGKSR